MVKRKVNTEKLNELVDKYGGVAQVSIKTGVSISWLEKAMAGCYEHGSRRLTRDALCNKFRVDVDELFPTVTAKGKAS